MHILTLPNLSPTFLFPTFNAMFSDSKADHWEKLQPCLWSRWPQKHAGEKHQWDQSTQNSELQRRKQQWTHEIQVNIQHSICAIYCKVHGDPFRFARVQLKHIYWTLKGCQISVWCTGTQLIPVQPSRGAAAASSLENPGRVTAAKTSLGDRTFKRCWAPRRTHPSTGQSPTAGQTLQIGLSRSASFKQVRVFQQVGVQSGTSYKLSFFFQVRVFL